MKKRVKCIKSWSLTDGYSPEPGEEFDVVRSFFFNGEGWHVLRAGDGTEFETPDVFYDSV